MVGPYDDKRGGRPGQGCSGVESIVEGAET